jgi:hypothetical protein
VQKPRNFEFFFIGLHFKSHNACKNGNLLSEGTLFVGAAISTMSSLIAHFYERDAVAFQVVESLDGDSARGRFCIDSLPNCTRVRGLSEID